MRKTDEDWMIMALNFAHEAEKSGEVPVGAVIVGSDGGMIATGYNQPITRSDPTAHAEIIALRNAGQGLGNYRLNGCTIYTTVEPCAMCAGALVNARISRLVYGARDERFGAVETHFRICDSEVLNHRMEVTGRIMEQDCRRLIQDFFRVRRA
ncbi:MAG: tRNA adenosine(34) deaminase TadA [Pyrinomonadaceae bacterium]